MKDGVKLEGFSDYIIYPIEGKVFSLKRNRFIGAQHPEGYWCVTLTDDDGKQHSFRRCRLIYETANGAIPEGLQVNHINETVWDDRLENLNLMSPKENCNFGSRNTRIAEKRSKQVGAYKDNVLVMIFPSTKEAGQQGYNQGNVSACCRGKLSHYKNYQWKYFN